MATNTKRIQSDETHDSLTSFYNKDPVHSQKYLSTIIDVQSLQLWLLNITSCSNSTSEPGVSGDTRREWARLAAEEQDHMELIGGFISKCAQNFAKMDVLFSIFTVDTNSSVPVHLIMSIGADLILYTHRLACAVSGVLRIKVE